MAESPPPTLLAWSFFVGGEWLVLHLPPAPDFVLRDSGPEAFAHKLERRIDQVFPICITSEILAEETGQRITVAIASDGRAG